MVSLMSAEAATELGLEPGRAGHRLGQVHQRRRGDCPEEAAHPPCCPWPSPTVAVSRLRAAASAAGATREDADRARGGLPHRVLRPRWPRRSRPTTPASRSGSPSTRAPTLAEQVGAGRPGGRAGHRRRADHARRVADARGPPDAPAEFATNDLELVVPAEQPGRHRLGSPTSRRPASGTSSASLPPPAERSRPRALDDRRDHRPAGQPGGGRQGACWPRSTADEADAGLVYRTDAVAAGDQVEAIDDPAGRRAHLNTYPIAAARRPASTAAARPGLGRPADLAGEGRGGPRPAHGFGPHDRMTAPRRPVPPPRRAPAPRAIGPAPPAAAAARPSSPSVPARPAPGGAGGGRAVVDASAPAGHPRRPLQALVALGAGPPRSAPCCACSSGCRWPGCWPGCRSRGGRCCARWSPCRWCCRRWWPGSPCSPRSAAPAWSARRCATRSGSTVPYTTLAVVLAHTFVALPFFVLGVRGGAARRAPRATRRSPRRSARAAGRRSAGSPLPLALPGVLAGLGAGLGPLAGRVRRHHHLRRQLPRAPPRRCRCSIYSAPPGRPRGGDRRSASSCWRSRARPRRCSGSDGSTRPGALPMSRPRGPRRRPDGWAHPRRPNGPAGATWSR